MKKGKVLCAALVACLAVPCFVAVGGCKTEKAFYVTENTSYLELKEKLDAGNYSVIYNTYNIGYNTVNQSASYYDGNTMLDVLYFTIGDKVGIYKNYNFVNFEKGQLVQYNVGYHNMNITDNYDIEVTDEFKIDYAEKKYFEYNTFEKDYANFEFLTSYKNKLIVKDGLDYNLEFKNGNITTTQTKGFVTQSITLTDIGTTKINLPANIVKAGLNADWAEVLECDDVVYQVGYRGYEAVIEDDFWAKHSTVEIRSTINGQKVSGVQIETPLSSYVGFTIKIDADCVENRIANMGDPFEYNIADFVEKGGKVIFNNQTFQKTFITETTTLADFEALIDAKNFTITKNTTKLLPSGEKSVLTEKTIYAGGEYIKETLQTIGNDVYKTAEYGIFVADIYYKVRYTNYDATGTLYSDGAYTYAYCSRADAEEQENLGKNFLSKLETKDGKLALKSTLDNVENMSLDFVFGNPEIKSLFVTNIGNVFEDCGEEVVKLSNIGSSRIVVPYYVFNKVVEQDADNPLHGSQLF
ncbi:MAG: hypothetical protein IJF22_02400 [Clostridia bacterium]|nr:hypothetical protein [Clostridia bacterium]